ncbi:MAG: nucleoside monophosphate kinase [Thermodesulfovibrionales bacterium]
MSIDAILLIGPTGAGKSPLGDHIQERGLSGKRCHHFDFGHQLRAIAAEEKPPGEFTFAEHRFVRDLLEKALLLEKEHFLIAEKIVSSFLGSRQYEQGDLVVLNGLPRHVGQARDMDQIVAVRTVVVLECSSSVVHKRICRDTGGDRAGRDDDDQLLIEKKLRIFRERTEPLVEHYRAEGSVIVRLAVTAEAAADHVYAELLSLVPQASSV